MNPATIATTPLGVVGFLGDPAAGRGCRGAGLARGPRHRRPRPPPAALTARGSGGLDLPPESPAVAGLLCDDFVVGAEAAPATLLDLVARRIVVLEEVQPGRTVCRLRGADDGKLAGYERMVLDQLRAKALDGVVPTEALTTGTDDVSAAWHRRFARFVVADAQQRGLTHDRWPTRLVSLLGLGALVVGVLIAASGLAGGDSHGDVTTVAAIAAAVAVLSIPVGGSFVARLGRSLAQLPTAAGLEAAATARGLQRTLQEHGGTTGGFADLPPAAVVLWDRVFAYAAAMGAARRRAVTLLPLGAEDDHRRVEPGRGALAAGPRALPPHVATGLGQDPTRSRSCSRSSGVAQPAPLSTGSHDWRARSATRASASTSTPSTGWAASPSSRSRCPRSVGGVGGVGPRPRRARSLRPDAR